MEIAVGVYSQSFVITEAYRSAGIIAGLSDFEMPAVFGLDINPFNVVLRNHGVIYTSHIDMNSTILNRDRRQMLFTAGFHGVGEQLVHLLTAAYHGNASIMDHVHQIAAVVANVERCFHQFFLLN